MKKYIIKISVATIILIFLDQISKYWAVKNIAFVYNPGVAFGIHVPKTLLIASTFVLLITLFVVAIKEFNLQKKLSQATISLVAAGGASNLLDRFTYGAVVDFIDPKIWPVFNFADVFIIVGVLSIIFFYEKLKR
ncbi:hypothetical protein COU74_00255 [Candidatus Peregrinibacteria bacterium CG10_big_fil_rev_8_21_14_0_10_36_19]|nr:MAG: hypothetical protein COU74_00255 [Candidatus Peregrinibacteria bacterium CG10_big_fil_rev_8_21_14_0_10_36_19]